MINLKLKLIKTINIFIGVLLTFLGFSCDKNGLDEYGSPVVEYGSPYATFIVDGTVTSASSSKAISNVQVIMGTDTSYTNESGEYEVSQTDYPVDQAFVLEINDIDGSSNGEYAAQDSTIEFTDSEFTGGDDDWYSGETTKTINIKLEDQE